MEAVSVIWGRAGCGLILFALTSASVIAAPEQSVPHLTTDEWLIKTWENEDGPQEYTATAMAQTADGFLWFGTFGGLERFDGVKLTSFNTANTPQLPNDGIVNLHLDARGWLWISTYRGLVVRQDKQWRVFGTNDGWAGDYVRTFAERTNGDLLITTFNGRVLEFSNNRLHPMAAPPGEHDQGYLAHVDEGGRWWVVQNRFIGQWDGERWMRMVTLDSNIGADVVGRGKAKDGGMWLLVGKALRKYLQGKEVSRIELPEMPGGIWDLFEDSRTNVWICTYDKGLCQVDSKGQMRRWTTTNGLPVVSVRFVFEDSENDLWVGTSGGGLTKFKPRRVRSLGREEGLVGEAHSVCSDPAGGLWIGTYGGGLFRSSEGGLTNVSPTGISNAVTYLQCVLKDSAGRLWLSTFLHGLWVVEQHTARPIPPEQTGGNNIIALFEDSRGRVWIGGGGARVVVCEGRQFRCVREESRVSQGLVSCFAEDRQGAIWFTDEAGVYRLENERFVEVRTTKNQPVKGITCLRVDSEGIVWMGSLDRGLLRWRDGNWAKVDQAAGLPRGAIYSMIEDRESVLWMATEAGIARAALTNLNAVANGTSGKLICQVLDRSDGLSSMAFSTQRQPACTSDLSGRLWFATGKGLAMIDPGVVRVRTSPPPVHIESIVYHVPGHRAGTNESEIHLSAPFTERLVLPAGSQRIEIAYTAPSFAAPEKVRFQVKLEGRDPDWRESATRRTAYLYETPPGNYLFRVRAANNDGIVNETGAGLAFTVLPFFWQTGWFRGLIGFAVLGEGGLIIGLLANRRRLNRTQAELFESERRMNLAGHAARLGMWVWEIGPDEIWITEDGRKLFGWTKTEVPNFERWISILHPEDREPTRAAVRSALEGHGDYEAEYRVTVAAGSMRWVAARGQVEFNGEGKPIRVRGVSIDITARKQAEEKFRLAVEASPNGIVLVDRQGSIVLANAQTEKMFGYERNELVGQPVEILVPHRFREHHPAHRGGFFAHPQARSMGAGRELFARRKDGSEFPVEIGLSPIQATEGLLVLTAIVDITTRKQAEAEAQRQRAELAHVARVSTMGELAASVAHELNQPLGAILSNAEAAEMFLNQNPPALQEVREILSDIRKDDERAGEVIRRMRTLLRKREMELEPLDLNSLMEDLFRLVSGDAALRKTAISAELAPTLPVVRGDRVHLQQVLLNLTMNAMEAMAKQPPEKRRLTMRTSLNGNRTLEVAVMDSGTGIEPDKLLRVFEPFFTTKPNGMGMGLSIARTIIEAHRGHISAENNASGGATFRVTLPVAGESTDN